MSRGARPVFLERKSYRRRRLMDALRLVAVLGAILWLIPVVWPSGGAPDAAPVPMSHALFYIFGVWVVLIALAAALALMLRDRPGSDAGAEQDADGIR